MKRPFKAGDKILVKKTAVAKKRYNGLCLYPTMKHTLLMEIAKICLAIGNAYTKCGWWYAP